MVEDVQGRRQPEAKPSYHAARVEDLAVEGDGGERGGDLSLWVRQWMSSVFGTEKETSSAEALRETSRKRPCWLPMLDLCDGDATVREKSSTYETMTPVGMRK